MAEPGSRDIGLAMKVAYMSCRSAASRIVRLNRNTWSASVERIAMQEIDLHLRRAFLVDQRVDLQALRFREIVDVVEQVVELVDRGDRIGLPRRLRPAGAAGRRLELIVGIGVRLDEIELDLRRHHRLPALVLIELDHAAQHLARRRFDRAAVAMIAVMDDLRGRIVLPRHDGERREIRLEQDVADRPRRSCSRSSSGG